MAQTQVWLFVMSVIHSQVSTTDSEVTSAAKFAAEQLSSQSNSLSPFEVKEVLSARTKVVSGKSYELKLKLSQGNMPEQIYQVGRTNIMAAAVIRVVEALYATVFDNSIFVIISNSLKFGQLALAQMATTEY